MFRLADVFKYRECGGDMNKMPELEGRMNAIKDPAIRVSTSHILKPHTIDDTNKAMTFQMIDLSPSLRPTFDTLLSNGRNTAFPEIFYDFYHGYVHSIEELPSPSPFTNVSQPNITTTSSAFTSRASNMPSVNGATGAVSEGTSTPTSAHPAVSAFSANSHTTFASSNTMHTAASNATGRTEVRSGLRADGDGHTNSLPRDADRRIDAIWSDFERVVPNLNQELRVGGKDNPHSNDLVDTWMSKSTQSRVSHVSQISVT
jgi:phosphoinositide-3-kinase regulatory subunit 4